MNKASRRKASLKTETKPEAQTTTILADPHRVKSDARMIEKAIRHGWNIPESILHRLPNIVATLALSSDDDRTRLAAMRVLIAMHGQNQKLDEPAAPQQTIINNGTMIDNRVEDRRTQIHQIAERVRTRRISDESSG